MFPTPDELCQEVEFEIIVSMNKWLKSQKSELCSSNDVLKKCETIFECQYIEKLLVEAGWIVNIIGMELKISMNLDVEENKNETGILSPKKIKASFENMVYLRFFNVIQAHKQQLCILKQKVSIPCSNKQEIRIAIFYLKQCKWQFETNDNNLIIWI